MTLKSSQDGDTLIEHRIFNSDNNPPARTEKRKLQDGPKLYSLIWSGLMNARTIVEKIVTVKIKFPLK